MKGSKYLSEIIDISTLKENALNIIKAPTGCGKTYFALNTIPSLCRNTKHEAVYLIDTINGKEQILRNYNAHPATKRWIKEIEENGIWFEENEHIVIMTYAKLGVILAEDPDFYKNFHYIICDEMHNLIRFQNFDNSVTNAHRIAKNGLKRAVRYKGNTVIALTATPNKVIDEFFSADLPIFEIPIDQEELIHFETKDVAFFTDIYRLIGSLDPQKTGILYSGRINSLTAFEETAKKRGFHPISIWSVNNTDHFMNENQLLARKTILEDFIIPSEYNLLLINSSSETSIKIKSHVDFMIVNSINKDTQIQVRGRVNNDLDVLYLPMTVKTIVVPEEFLDVKLFKEGKTKLCKYLNFRDATNGRQLGWNSVHDALSQINSGYQIIDGRDNNYRYSIIHKQRSED